MDFLNRSDFHQTLRNEILFGLIPKSLNKGDDQRNGIEHLMDKLEFRGLIKQDQGIVQLQTVLNFLEIIKAPMPNITFHQTSIDDVALNG